MDEFLPDARPGPTAARPLLGLTLLLVEDSRFASEAVRLMAVRSGARLRRADCISSARRHLGTYRPEVAIVDLGLPDGSGLSLISQLDGAASRPTVILGSSGLDDPEVEAAAIAAGADGFLAKPIASLASFQQAILVRLPPELRPRGPRTIRAEGIEPDRIALFEDLRHARAMLSDGQTPARYVADFLHGVARTGDDDELLASARGLAAQARDGTDPHGQGARDLCARLDALIAERLRHRAAI